MQEQFPIGIEKLFRDSPRYMPSTEVSTPEWDWGIDTGIGVANGDSLSHVTTLHDVRRMLQNSLTCTREWADDGNWLVAKYWVYGPY